MTNDNRGLSGEDVKLDALLKAARPVADAAREAALLARIVAAADRTPRLIARSPVGAAAAVEIAKPVEATVTPQRSAAAVTARPQPRRLFAAGGVLAASLVAGLILGQMPYAAQTVTRIEQATGLTLASASEDMIRTIAAEFEEEDL